ncbi:histidine kinase [Streptomyces sp. 71268]|nr:histidine kinase [Streptomyces sp. 71268]WEV30067.1 histidine kinase [Streptomyces sp. 71268]
MWPPRRVVGEVLLMVVAAVLAAGAELALDGSGPRVTAVTLATALVAPLRRVLPATVLLAVIAASTEFAGLAPLVPVLAWSAGRRIAGVGAAVGTFAAAYLTGLVLTAVTDLPRTPAAWVFAALLLLVFVVLPGLVGRYSAQRRALVDTFREYNAQLLREREMTAEQARLRERQRIAQDMHDSLGHQLVLMSVHSGALEVDRELTDRQREAVRVLREASVAAMHELREVVGLLRDGTPVPESPEEAEAATRGVAGVEDLVAASRRAGTTVELRSSGRPRPLAPAVDHAAYRVAQEGLTNAHKHAPGAAITVALRYEPDSLIVEVANGPATSEAAHGVVSGGQGLTGLGERTRLVGGMVHAGPTAGGGFRLAGVLPYTPAESAAPVRAARGATATFVDASGDVRRQFPSGPGGEGGPVIDEDGLPKELVKAMRESRRRGRVAVGCGVAVGIGLLLVVAAGVGVWFLAQEAEKAMIDRGEFDAVRVGQSEAEVRDRLPDGKSFLAEDLTKGAPPEPAGSTCLTLMSTEVGGWDTEPVFRFCFRDGKLIEKKSFDVDT